MSAVAAVGALIVAAFAFVGQVHANRTADAANDLAKRNDERLNRQSAEGVALGTAPASIADKHPLPPGVVVWYVVYNSTNKPIENVWVSDDQGGSIRISGIEPCTMYALDPHFQPKELYFSDADGLYWHRHYNGQPEQLTKSTFPPMPDPDTADSPWLANVQNCSSS